MKISIITTSYNSSRTIGDTIDSVIGQDYSDFEYIIIDGASTDNTSVVVESYGEKIDKFVSEPDSGIYDAMNKGIRLATGAVIGIINSDDILKGGGVLKEVAKIFSSTDCDAVYGDIVYCDRNDLNKKVRSWQAGAYHKDKLKSGWIMPHPAFFVKKEVYDRYGVFRSDFKIAADYELMLRFLQKDIKVVYLNKVLVKMREGGFSANSFGQRFRGWKELYRAWKVNNLRPPIFLFLTRIFSKVNQYFK